jgi:hypothetical protein
MWRTDVSEERIVFIFKIEKQAAQETSKKQAANHRSIQSFFQSVPRSLQEVKAAGEWRYPFPSI